MSDMLVLSDRNAEEVFVGFELGRLAMRGYAAVNNDEELAAYRLRLVTVIKVLAHDDPEQETFMWHCYRAALQSKETPASVAKRIKEMSERRKQLGIQGEWL